MTLTHAAHEDLRSIRSYTLNAWGAEQEQRDLDQMWARFDSIRLDPERYRQREDLFPGCRIAAEGKHVILFKSGKDSLEIIRVLHAAMDFKTQLGMNNAGQ